MVRACLLLLYDVLLISLAVEDFKYRKIRNYYVKMILLLSAVSVFIIPEISIMSRVSGMIAVSLPMVILNIIRPGSFGGGDVKLTFASGAFLGAKILIMGTLGAILLAGGYSLYLICTKKEQEKLQFPLGPFLSIGYIICLFLIL